MCLIIWYMNGRFVMKLIIDMNYGEFECVVMKLLMLCLLLICVVYLRLVDDGFW